MADNPTQHPLEKTLGHGFADPELLVRALTHRGALGAPVKGKTVSPVDGNERLEFLGDRVLGLVIADKLLRTFPDENEGGLAPRLATLVSASTLAQVAVKLNLAKHLKVAKGHRVDLAEPSVLADACEAVIGALYLDGGLDAADAFISAQWDALMKADLSPPKDAKTALQEWAQGHGLPLPEYKVVESAGPAHAPSFTMTVHIQGYPEKSGQGRTKRLATQAAASVLLATLPEDT